MRLLYVTTLLVLVGCSRTSPTTYELAAVALPSTNPNHSEVELRFTAPKGAAVSISADDITVTQTSSGSSIAKLSFAPDSVAHDGSRTLTTLVGLGSQPNTGSGRTVNENTKLDVKLAINRAPATVAYGVPSMIGEFNGRPITLLVKPKLQ